MDTADRPDIPPRLIPIAEFEEAVRKVLRTPKKEVDRKLADLQAKHKAKREARRSGN